MTLTVAAGSNLFSTALEATVRGEGTITSALATLPILTLEGGTFETTVAAQAPSVSLEGGTLALSDVLTVVDGFESHGAGAVRIPVSPSGADGWLAMAEGGLVPNVANVVFTLALDLAGAESLRSTSPARNPSCPTRCPSSSAPTVTTRRPPAASPTRAT